MKLTEKDLLNIDGYLIKKGIKYIDVRYELIDHLVSEYELMYDSPDLETFLRKRTAWCRKISNQKEKAIHRGGQKALLKRILSFFRDPIFYAALVIFFFVQFYLNVEFGTAFLYNTLVVFLISVIVLQYVDFSYHRMRTKDGSKLLSRVLLINIYSLPNIFLHLIFLFQEQFKVNAAFSITYFTIGLMVNIAALLEVRFKRKRTLEEYDFLKSHIA